MLKSIKGEKPISKGINLQRKKKERTCQLLLGVLVLAAAFVVCSSLWGNRVTILVDGREYSVVQFGGTVADALNKAKVTLRGTDMVNPSLESRVSDGQRVKVTRVTIKEVISDQVLTGRTEKKVDPSLLPGQQVVIQAGTCGLAQNYYRVTYWDGQEQERELVKREVVREPRPIVVACGPTMLASRGKTRPLKTVAGNTTAPGDMVPERVITAVSTAYTNTGHRTATGITPHKGVVSVDPRVIPLGTKLYVENYGPAVALDTGGDMKGNRIDVFFDNPQEAKAWGRRKVNVLILE